MHQCACSCQQRNVDDDVSCWIRWLLWVGGGVGREERVNDRMKWMKEVKTHTLWKYGENLNSHFDQHQVRRLKMAQYSDAPSFISYFPLQNKSTVVLYPLPVVPTCWSCGWIVYALKWVKQTIITHIQHVFRQANFACHCTPLFTKQKVFCSTSLISVYPTYYSTTLLSALLCNVY